MKTFWKIIGFSLLALVILLVLAIIGGLFFLKSFDIKKYKPQIIAAAAENLGRTVDFKDIQLEVSLEKGVRLRLGDFTIAEAPEFGTGNFVTIKQVDAGVDILAYVLSRQVSVPGIVINSLQIEVVRDAQGVLNISTIGPVADATAKTSSAPAAALPAIFINSLRVENAQITLVDKSVTPELKLAVTQVNLDVQRFSLSNPFDILLEAALLSSQKNFRLEGKAQLKLDNQEVKLSDMGIALQLGQLPLETLRAFPLLAGVPFPQLMDGQLNVRIKEAEISQKGLGKILADVAISGGKIIAPDIVPGISLEAKHLDLNVENISLDGVTPVNVSLKAAVYQDAANLDLSGKVVFDLKAMKIQVSDGQFATDLALWPVKKIKAQISALKDVQLPENLSGKVQTTIKELTLTPAGVQSILMDAKLEGGAVDLSALISGMPTSVTKTDLTVSNFALGKQFSVIFKTAYASEVQNLSFDGILSFDLADQSVQIKNGIAAIDLNNFPLARFKDSSLIPAGTPFPKTLGGRLQLQVHELSASAKGLGMIKMNVKLQSGKVEIDEVVPGISVAAQQINLELQNLSLTEPFQIKGSLGYESDDPNIFVDGQVSFDTATQKVSLKDFTVTSDLAKVPFEKIKARVAPLNDVQLPDAVKGEMLVVVKELSAGPAGLTSLLSEVTLKEWEVKLKELTVPVSGVETKFNITESRLAAEDLRFNLGQGQIAAKVNVEDYLKTQNFDISAEIKDLNLTEILVQDTAQVKVAGLVSANLKAKGQGADISSITGEGNVEVKEAKLKDLNVLKTVLDKIDFIPGLLSRVQAKLPEQYSAKLEDPDTSFKTITSTIAISGGNFILEPITVEADEFIFTGNCQAALDQTYVLDGSFQITAELSAIMGDSSEEFQYLYDANNLITFPVHVSGQGASAPVFSVTQTVGEMGKNAARTQVKKELRKVLGDVLGGTENSQSQNQEAPAEGSEAPQQEDPASQIIGGILDKVFK